jgi:hypothetical protein
MSDSNYVYQVYVMLPRSVDVPPQAAAGEVAFFLT